MTQQVESWRSRNYADTLSSLDRNGLAFEFLRRNRVYREDYRRAMEDIASGKADRNAAMAALSNRWRCFFRRRSGSIRKAAAVLAGGRPGHGDPHGCADGISGPADTSDTIRNDPALGGFGEERKDDRS
ncbi:DUF6499 domain-containing protein [Brucella pseudogrignonensis]|uniref:transcriptional regulator domain-containing protein n=1 Tax=Brucella pseudogrignonensis TaxID=419475 RepID=UPI001E503347|nr:DUF6499 domain-containing protein [Brucella pseudogrignonensis]MCD4512184.1 DUF6499 domain-containing protein [Brucella pseudogrignonensis]